LSTGKPPGASGVPKQGGLRMSGHPKAHLIGGIKPIKNI
jgi:hypothetical protein